MFQRIKNKDIVKPNDISILLNGVIRISWMTLAIIFPLHWFNS